MWPEDLAKKIIKERGKKLLVSTMVTPSGPMHLGNLRELLTGYLVTFALNKKGAKARQNFLVDNFDHLRQVYPFLPKKFQKYVGHSISEIPDPQSCHKTYDQHFLDPFLKALSILNVKPKIYFVDQLYKKGIYAPLIKKALEKRDKIAQIISNLTGRKIEKDWSPFMPLCQKCGKISETKITDLDLDKNLVFYQCSCGQKGKADFSKGEGKLVWRVHWPATWNIFGVDVEGFGKDLATKGGAYETGKAILEEVFEGKAPIPIPYEWIYIKGVGPMAGSTGLGFLPLEILKILPPEILKYFYQRSKPNKHLHFDPGEEIISLWNEYGGLSGIPFEHLVMTVQSASDFKGVLETLKRTGYQKEVKKQNLIKKEIDCVQNWLKKYAPESYKFEVQEKLPKIKLTKSQKEFLSNILKMIEGKKFPPSPKATADQPKFLTKAEDGEKLHKEIHQIKKEMKIDPREAFSAIYLVFLGKDSGPQAGWFLASLDRGFVVKRLKEAVK